MSQKEPDGVLSATDWIVIGAAPTVAGLLILAVVVLGWTGEPQSPWGRVLADVFYTHPIAAGVLVLLGLPALWKGYTTYRAGEESGTESSD